jgi:hypothetical protein
MSRRRRLAFALVGLLLGGVGTVAAHGAGLSGSGRSLDVPTWLFLATGGGVVGASFLLASFVTDRAFIRRIHDWRRSAHSGARVEEVLIGFGTGVGLAGLLFVLTVGLFGPSDPLFNGAVLLVWVGWWSGYAMTAYLAGNSWPVLNPWRTLAEWLPSLARTYPDRLGAWPSVVGLLALVWLEVVSPVASQPRFLAGIVLAYTAVTLASAAVFGPRWFETVDPVSRVFRYFGRVAPLYYDEGIRIRLPGTGLDEASLVTDRGEVGFVVGMLWVTTYDGLVATPAWRRYAVAVVEPGRARFYDGDRYAKACQIATGGPGDGQLEERVGNVVDLIEQTAAVRLPALTSAERNDPTAVADAYDHAYDALLATAFD